ncbi:MAG: hypothetical protein DWH97_10585 [Planctomycetota bacterium]|nr:MAG: hypothetical protein DWH97_10585 [Planctomycetota bacterium]RLS93030.1 MAG: hypothetical protein DWI12_10105 [Planctomycetota bacterium]
MKHTAFITAFITGGIVALSALVAGITDASHAQCPAEGDCRKVHPTPGCDMPECCTIVCEANPLCCEFTWDQACADFAILSCADINCPSDGLCTQVHASPGCADFECCELVTILDGWCSYAAWDEVCAREALALCGVTPCVIALPTLLDEDEPCYERFNDGCSITFSLGRIELPCATPMKGRIVSGGPRDTDWFALDGATRRRYRFTLDAEFPIELQLFEGDCEGPNHVEWLIGEELCVGAHTLVFLVDSGVQSLVLGAGNEDRALRSGLECDDIDPENPPEPDDPPALQVFGVHWIARLDCLALGDINGDGLVNAVDIGTLLNAWGEVDASSARDPRLADADLDGNGRVDAADLTVLLSSW